MKRSSCPLDDFIITAPIPNDSKVISILKTASSDLPAYIPRLQVRPKLHGQKHVRIHFKEYPKAYYRQHNFSSDSFLPDLNFLSYFPTGPEDSQKIWDLQTASDMFGVVQVKCPNADVWRCIFDGEIKPRNPLCIHYLPSG